MYSGDVDPFDEIHSAYFSYMSADYHPQGNARSCNLNFTYSAMHGVGAPFAR